MNTPLGLVLRITQGSALAGFAIYGSVAAYDVFTRPHVREFQAGPESSTTERLFAVAQQSAIEGVGSARSGSSWARWPCSSPGGYGPKAPAARNARRRRS